MLTLPLYATNTLPIEKMKKFDFDELSQLRTTIEKTEEGKIFSKQKCALVPKTNVRKKRAPQSRRLTYLSQRAVSFSSTGRTGSVFHGSFTLQERPIKYRKCPTFDATAIFRHLIDK